MPHTNTCFPSDCNLNPPSGSRVTYVTSEELKLEFLDLSRRIIRMRNLNDNICTLQCAYSFVI